MIRGHTEPAGGSANASGSTHEDLYGLFIHGRMPRSYSAGEVIFSEGDVGDGMYIVGRGQVALKHDDRTIDTVTNPGLFGEMAKRVRRAGKTT